MSIATIIDPPGGVIVVSYSGHGVNTLLSSSMRGQPLAVTGPLNDDLIAGIGQAVQGAVAQDRVVKDAQPLFHGPVASDYEAGLTVAGDDKFIEIDQLLSVESLQAEVVQDGKISGNEQGSKSANYCKP